MCRGSRFLHAKYSAHWVISVTPSQWIAYPYPSGLGTIPADARLRGPYTVLGIKFDEPCEDKCLLSLHFIHFLVTSFIEIFGESWRFFSVNTFHSKIAFVIYHDAIRNIFKVGKFQDHDFDANFTKITRFAWKLTFYQRQQRLSAIFSGSDKLVLHTFKKIAVKYPRQDTNSLCHSPK